MTAEAKRNLQTQAGFLASDIRRYVRRQHEIWQQVPLLILRAWVLTGARNVRYERALSYGVWPVHGSTAVIDCVTGEMYEVAFGLIVAASDANVVSCACHLDDLDASMVIAGLKAEAARASSQHVEEQLLRTQRFEREVVRLGIGERFTEDMRQASLLQEVQQAARHG